MSPWDALQHSSKALEGRQKRRDNGRFVAISRRPSRVALLPPKLSRVARILLAARPSHSSSRIDTMPYMKGDISSVLIAEPELKERVSALAGQIAAVYQDRREGIVIVSILAGSIIFLADLIRQLPMKMRIGMVTVSSYPGRATKSRGSVLQSAEWPRLRDRDVLIVDDILDTGGTLRVVQAEVRSAAPRSVRTVVLLRKPARAPDDVTVDFVGFDILDDFVVGYGLDYDGLYRNLPYIAVLRRPQEADSPETGDSESMA